MALDNSAVLQVGGGHFYTAPAGTDAPTALNAVGTPWVEVGHTSLDSILTFASSGGDATTLGTLQAPTLLQTFSARTESFSFVLEQWDDASLKLYFGSNMVDASTANPGKWLGVPNTPEPTESAFLVALNDGTNYFGLWAPRAQLFRGDDATINDTQSIAGLPISVTPLVFATNTFTYALTPIATV